MNIKSLLLGSAVAVVAATSVRAADAIIIAEPEPMEYVRICDAYGVGFFYIPGTETCLRVGGLVRHEWRYTDYAAEFTTFTRFQLNVDARSETEWGTLRSYVEGRFDYTSGLAETNSTYLNQGFIELQQAAGTWRLGKTDTAYARYLGYGGPFGPFDNSYAFNNANELSYQFNGGNGFTAILAVHDRKGSSDFDFGVEGGARLAQAWGNVGAMVGYDTLTEEWGAKAVANANFGMFTVGGHLYYSSSPFTPYSIGSGIFGDSGSEFSVLAYGTAKLTDTLSAGLAFQWFDDEYLIANDGTFEITAGLNWTPVAGLQIRPEVQYGKTDFIGGGSDDRWRSTIRFQRSF